MKWTVFKLKLRNLGKEIYSFLETHLAFILTFFVTYVLGLVIVAIVIRITNEIEVDEHIRKVKFFLEFMTPTTFAYTLTNAMTYVMQAQQKKKAVWSWFLIVLSIGYILFYILYEIDYYKTAMLVLMSGYTGVLLVFNAFAYKEHVADTKHKHSISA